MPKSSPPCGHYVPVFACEDCIIARGPLHATETAARRHHTLTSIAAVLADICEQITDLGERIEVLVADADPTDD